MTSILDRIIDDLRRLRLRVDAMVTRGVVEMVNDRLKTQRLQVTILADEHENDVEHMQPYGLSFVPPADAEVIALAPSGSRAGTVAICAQLPGDRPEADGDRTGGLYTRGEWRVFIDADGTVHLAAKLGAAKMARADRVEAELNAIWTALATTSAVNGAPLVPGPREAGDVGADGVRGT